jgi:hypothetical protein
LINKVAIGRNVTYTADAYAEINEVVIASISKAFCSGDSSYEYLTACQNPQLMNE